MLQHDLPYCTVIFLVTPWSSILRFDLPNCAMIFRVSPWSSMLWPWSSTLRHDLPYCSMTSITLFYIVTWSSILQQGHPGCSISIHIVAWSVILHSWSSPLQYDLPDLPYYHSIFHITPRCSSNLCQNLLRWSKVFHFTILSWYLYLRVIFCKLNISLYMSNIVLSNLINL